MSVEVQKYIPFTEPFDAPERAEHAPVLLDPWNTNHPLNTETPYILASNDRIKEKLYKSMVDAMDWWVDSPEHAAILLSVMEDSLWDAQMMRIHRNAVRQPLGSADFMDDDMTESLDVVDIVEDPLWELDYSDPLVAKVMDGKACPAEMVAFHKRHPQIQSTELAKESHPLDFLAAKDLKAAVEEAIDIHRGLRINSQPHYKVKTFDEENLIMTAVRKQIIAAIPTDRGPLIIVQREGLIIRGDEEARGDDAYLPRKMRNPERHHELWDKAEGYLSYIDATQTTRYVDIDPQVKWIQPLTTSVYEREQKPRTSL